MAISIFSPQWDEYDSYGIIARHLADAVLRCGQHVNRLGGEIEDQQIVPSFGGIMLGYPTMYQEYGALAQMGKRVAVTMFESTQLPEGWVENLNRCDAVIVPAEFLVQIFRDNGVTVPIHVVPLGVNETYFDVVREPRYGRPYTFLSIADRGMRKGWELAWHAFRKAFGDSEDYKLILKCREGGLPYLNSADANVEILRADLTHEEMAELYARCDAMVFPTRGEGFGLPPREFAATGAPALVTRWGGTADCLNEWGYGVSAYRMVDAWPHHEKLEGLGRWAEVDARALSDQMRILAKFEGCLEVERRAAFVKQYYRWEQFADSVLEIYYGT